MVANIFELSFVPKNGSKISKIKKGGPKWSKITKNRENHQNSPKLSGTHTLIFEYLRINLGKYNLSPKYVLIYFRAIFFKYSFVIYFF